MAMDGTSGGVGQGGGNRYPPASGFGIYNPPAPAAQLPENVSGIFPNTSPLPPTDASYVHRPVHIGTVAGHHNRLSAGFLTNEQSNTVVGRMIADHLLFLRSNKITPSKTYSSQGMENLLRG